MISPSIFRLVNISSVDQISKITNNTVIVVDVVLTTLGPLKHQIFSTLFIFWWLNLLFFAPKILKSTFFEAESLLFFTPEIYKSTFFSKIYFYFFCLKGVWQGCRICYSWRSYDDSYPPRSLIRIFIRRIFYLIE